MTSVAVAMLVFLELFGIGFALMIARIYFEYRGDVPFYVKGFLYASVILFWPLCFGMTVARWMLSPQI